MGSVLESRESSKNEDGKTDIICKTMYANSEDFQVLAISTMVSLFGAEWNDYTMQMGGDAKPRNLLHLVMNVPFRNYLLDAEHPIADSDVCLYVLLPVFSAFQLFAQGRHEHPQRSDIVFPTAAPNLLRDIGVCQNLTNIFGEQAQQLVFDGCQV